MRTSFGLRRALVAAALAHALFFALMGARKLSARHARDSEPRAHRAPSTVDIDLEPETAPTPPPSSASSPAALPAPAAERAPSARSAKTSPVALGAVAAESSPSPVPADAPSSNDDWTLPTLAPAAPAAPDLGLALQGTSSTMRAAARAKMDDAPTSGDEDGASAGENLRATLDAHDRELGLGSGGPLVNLTREAVRDGFTPTVGHALFEMRTDGAGLVVSVRVLDATSDRRAWDDVATTVAKTARAHPLHVPKGAHGVAVTLRVDSAYRLKSAHDAGETAVSLMGVPLKRSSAAHPVRVDIALIPIPLASLNMDPTDALLDATSKPERVVSARIVREERL